MACDPGIVRLVAMDLRATRQPFRRGYEECIHSPIRGIYAFWQGPLCLYIGMSIDIARRLRHHRLQEHNEALEKRLRAYWRDVDASHVVLPHYDERCLRAIESALIDTLQPRTNLVRPQR